MRQWVSMSVLVLGCAVAACDESSAGSEVSDAAGSGDGSGAVALPDAWFLPRLRVTPDPVELRMGETPALSVELLQPDGTATPLEFELTPVTNTALWNSDGTAASPGSGLVRVSAHGLTRDVFVRVGSPIIAVAGDGSVRSVDLPTAADELLPSQVGPFPTRLVAHRGDLYAVSSGDVFGGTSPSTVLRLSDDGTATALGPLDAPGAYDLVFAGDHMFALGVGNGVAVLAADTGTPERTVDLAAAYAPRSIALQSGGAGLVVGDRILVADPGLRADFSYEPGALLVLDATSGEPVDYDPSTPAIVDPLPLPAGCVNPAALGRDRELLWVQCGGDFGATPAGVAILDARTWDLLRFVSMGDGSASITSAVDPSTATLYLGSAFGLDLAAVDLRSGTLLRSFGAGGFAITESPDFDFTSLFVDPRQRVWVISSGSDEAFVADRATALATDPVAMAWDASPGTAAVGVSLLGAFPGTMPPRWLAPAQVSVVDSGTGAPPDDEGELTGPPAGGGADAPNADDAELVTLPEGGGIDVRLLGSVIVAGAGPELCIYENAFFAQGDRRNRAIEPASVAWSADGLTFTEVPSGVDEAFPAVTASNPRRFLGQLVGVEPVFPVSGALPGDPELGGDCIDLNAPDGTAIRALRLTDFAGDHVQADIDAIGLIHWRND